MGGRGGRGFCPGLLTADHVAGRVPCRELRREGRASQAVSGPGSDPGSAQVCWPGPSPQRSSPPLPFSGLPWILWGKQENTTAMRTGSLGLQKQPVARDCGPDCGWVWMGTAGTDTAWLPGRGLTGLRPGPRSLSPPGTARACDLWLPSVTPQPPLGPQDPVCLQSPSLPLSLIQLISDYG